MSTPAPRSGGNRHKKGRKPAPHRGSLAIAGVLALLAFAASGHLVYRYLAQPGQLPLRVIEINGEFTNLQHAAVQARVLESIDGGFFTVNMQAVRDAVRGMPWVEEVSVRRVWPDTLRMHVTEQLPLARWNGEALVNLHGEVFRPGDPGDPGDLGDLQALPRLQGDDQLAPQVVGFYLRLRRSLVDVGLKVQRLQLNARQEWEVSFDSGLSLMLGNQQVATRLEDFLRVYPQLRGHMPRVAERIDMRYEHGFAVRWQAAAEDALAGG